MHDLNVVIIEERVDRVNKQLILYSRKRTICIQGDPERPENYSHVKVTTIQNNCKDNKDDNENCGYLIKIKAYRGGGGNANKSSSI